MVQSVATSAKVSTDILGVVDSSIGSKQVVSGRQEFQSQLNSASNDSQPVQTRSNSDAGNLPSEQSSDVTASVPSSGGRASSNNDASSGRDRALSQGQISPTNAPEFNEEPEGDTQALVFINKDVTDTDTDELLNLFSKIKKDGQTTESGSANNDDVSIGTVFVNNSALDESDFTGYNGIDFAVPRNGPNSEYDVKGNKLSSLTELPLTEPQAELAVSSSSLANEQVIDQVESAVVGLTSELVPDQIISDSSTINLSSDVTSVVIGTEPLSEPAKINVLVESVVGTSDQTIGIEENGTDEVLLSIGPGSTEVGISTPEGGHNSFNFRAATRNLAEEFAFPDEITNRTEKTTTTVIQGINQSTQSTVQIDTSNAGDLNIVAQVLGITEAQIDGLATQVGQLVAKDTGATQVVAKEVAGALQSVLAQIDNQLKKGEEITINLADIVESVSQRLSSGASQLPAEQVASLTQPLSSAISSSLQTLVDPESLNSSLGFETRLASEVQHNQLESAKLATSTNTHDKGVALGKPEAAQQLADKVQVIVNQKNLTAEIKLDPQELGALQVRLQLNGDQANVNFTVQNQTTRDLLEQAVPRLRELLQDKGIELGQSSVQQEQKEGRSQDSDGHSGSYANESEELVPPQNEVIETRVVNGHLGAIDYFA